MIWPTLLVFGGSMAWRNWGVENVGKRFYPIDAQVIHLTEKPQYIQGDIAGEVYEHAKLSKLSLLDPAAAGRIATAFSHHPWVKEVLAVRKLPGGEVEVHLQYRRPVAMVFVISRHSEVKGKSFFAVDEDGVVLPTTEFTREQTMSYLHIEIPDVYPSGGAGFNFGDARVASAAKIAALVGAFREPLQLQSIQLAHSSRPAAVPQFELLAKEGKRYFWGSAPGQEQAGEPSSELKLKELYQLVHQATLNPTDEKRR